MCWFGGLGGKKVPSFSTIVRGGGVGISYLSAIRRGRGVRRKREHINVELEKKEIANFSLRKGERGDHAEGKNRNADGQIL